MVLERAHFAVLPGAGDRFEAALGEARSVIAASPGFVSLELHRGVESPEHYLLLVEWETLADHVVGFRESDAFARWRALIGPFFAAPPDVEHFEPVAGLG